MLKGNYTSISTSVLLHLLLLLVIISSTVKQPPSSKPDKPEQKSIKSFLYVNSIKPLLKSEVKKQITRKNVLKSEPVQKKMPASSLHKSEQVSQKTRTINKTQQSSKTATVKDFSSFEQLTRLRQKINKRQREQALSELTQERTLSVMNGEPFPVPRSVVPLTADQQAKGRTTTSHVGSITKNDDGTCTIHREQMLGSPVEATTAHFSCGESKFDASFRQHMKKVKAKHLR